MRTGEYRASRTAPSGPPPRAPEPRSAVPSRTPRRRGRRGARVLVLILALVLVYLLGIPLATWPFMPRTDAAPTGQRPPDSPGFVYVLAGSDSREGMSTDEQNKLGTGNDAGRRTDTIMLLYVPPSGRAALISVPRDSYVAIPGHGKNKINAAYSFGGAPLLVQTIEQNTGLHVDGYVEVGFGGFVNVVDAVGGIEMCPPTAIKDRDSNLDIPAGCQQMDGTTALGYVRMRKADPEGDLGRAKRQREMVSALAKKMLSPATVALPWRWWGVNSSTSKALTIGDDTGPAGFFGLGAAALKVGTGQADTLSVPVGNANANTPAGSSVLWDAARSKAFFEAMKRGEGDLKQYA
ncbi:LCP family protein [Propioniciclava coleopterorum]|uniref:LCP family protein n=1 Tax=Propioniciclava coleopterorum TaxID=2714937 RepID=A0A6G7YAD1_9ACTN|nr:LCP family protein [Propioniciclava coleopterorum]